MTILWVAVEVLRQSRDVELGPGRPPVFQATMVLQLQGGQVGIVGTEGLKLTKELLGESIVLERANQPRWKLVGSSELAKPPLLSHFGKVATCSSVDEVLLQELSAVSRNASVKAANDILARHGKPLRPIQPTRFDKWVVEGRVCAEALPWLLQHCSFGVWSHSDWGVYARVFRDSEEELHSWIQSVTDRASLALKFVDSESELPSW